MKLLRTKIENFRLLKDVEIDFTTGEKCNLTVIRAANESGKTTLLTALQWGLFGDEGLPGQVGDFRLSPLDASNGEKASVDISVEIDFTVTVREREDTYQLIRSVTETVRAGKWYRESAHIKLFRLESSGAAPLSSPDAYMRPHLPAELREVFFTDGDRALSFIEGDMKNQMKQVENAIRSLLGFNVIEKALEHIQRVGADVNRKIRKESGARKDLEAAANRLSQLKNEAGELEQRTREAEEARKNLEEHEQEADRKLSAALRKGDKQELEQEKKTAHQGRKAAEKDSAQADRDQSNLFRSELLDKHLLAEPFSKAKEILERLHAQGEIPIQTIPVLEDRLDYPICICGESLDADNADGKKRRMHIRNLIEENRNRDEIRSKITELYYSAQELLNPAGDRTWKDEYAAVFERRQNAGERGRQYGEKERAVEVKIDDLPDVDIQQLKAERDHYRDQSRSKQREEVRFGSQLELKRKTLKEAEADYTKLLQKDEKGLKFAAELDVANDLENIMKNSLETMKTRELKKVAKRMNDLFLDMIGADVSQRAIITRADVTPDFRIVVFGQYEQPLDPSKDLNGASRRALTLAFILALTKVSEVEAPNVIDTPLGMTSGYVKTAILQLVAQQSSQLILFLTHDEIKGCEDILDTCAGRVYTFTNPAHYPRILINEPPVNDAGILVCKCSHKEDCELCRRRETVTVNELNTGA